MDDDIGLRERKRLRTRAALSDAAIRLFLARGYDDVSISEVAAEAEVSRRTLFAYFPCKEDLVLHRLADHEEQIARVVRERPPGTPPLDALHECVRTALIERDPFTGLCDRPQVVAFYRLIIDTPALMAAMTNYQARSSRALAAALAEVNPDEPVIARIAAAQVIWTHTTLATLNQERVAKGESADSIAPDALANLDRAYDLLRNGMAPFR